MQIFSSFGPCCGGYGMVEMVGGCGPFFFFASFSFSSVVVAGGCLW